MTDTSSSLKLSTPSTSNNNNYDVGGDDRISELPDSLLCHIMSFLATKDAAATEILSKRWKNVWTLVPNLDLDDGSNKDDPRRPLLARKIRHTGNIQHDKFIDFMYWVLRRRRQCHHDPATDVYADDSSSCSCSSCTTDNDASSCSCGTDDDDDVVVVVIRKFSLHLSASYLGHHLSKWIRGALEQHRVSEEFDLRPSPKLPMFFPNSCFAHFKTLQVLKFGPGITLGILSNSTVFMPNLKTLHLISIRYLNFDAALTNLLFGCPNLEDLFIQRFHDEYMTNFIVSAPTITTLKYLTLDIHFAPFFEYKLKIDAPSVQFLKLKDHRSHDFSTGNLSALVEAHVDVANTSSRSGDCLFKLLKNLENAKFISLSAITMKTLSDIASDYEMPLFHNLTRLTVEVGRCYWDVLSNLLENSPCLQILIIEKRGSGAFKLKPSWRQPQRVPECMLLHFTTFDFIGFDGSNEEELEFLRYILEKAKVLKEMIIRSHTITLDARFNLLQKLSMFPRGSSRCQLVFH